MAVVLRRALPGGSLPQTVRAKNAGAVASSRLTRRLMIAAGAAGAAEVVLVRVAAPVASHVPGFSGSGALALIGPAGGLALRVTFVLVVLTAVSWVRDTWNVSTPVALSVLAVVGSTFVLLALDTSEAALLVHLAVVLAAVVFSVSAFGGVPVTRASALALVGVAIAASQWPLLLDSLGRVAEGIRGSAVVARGAAELALVAALVLLALTALRGGRVRGRSFLGAAVGAVAAAIALSLAGEQIAIVALWAVGATLWLPALSYVVTAGAVGLLLTTWLVDRSTRHLAAAVVLLAVAGIGPMLVHHNLTALVALMALAAVPPAKPRRAFDDRTSPKQGGT